LDTASVTAAVSLSTGASTVTVGPVTTELVTHSVEQLFPSWTGALTLAKEGLLNAALPALESAQTKLTATAKTVSAVADDLTAEETHHEKQKTLADKVSSTWAGRFGNPRGGRRRLSLWNVRPPSVRFRPERSDP
jgi:hypothetical protein